MKSNVNSLNLTYDTQREREREREEAGWMATLLTPMWADINRSHLMHMRLAKITIRTYGHG